MFQKDIISGYKKLEEMKSLKLPASVSLKIFMFKKQIKEFFDWQLEEEKKIFESYGAEINENGKIVVPDSSRIKDFTNEINALGEVEHDNIDKITVPADAFEVLSIEDIEVLSKIFNFT